MIHDALIIGAGPAGSAAAYHAAKAGLRVTVLEKSSAWPRYKTCGGGVLTRAANEIARMNVDLAAISECSFHQLEMNLLESGLTFRATRNEPIVRMAMRSDLDAALMSAATRAGAEFRLGCAITALTQTRTGVHIQSTQGEMNARFLIAADGANSPTARLTGWKPAENLTPALEWEVQTDAATLARFSATARFDFDLPPDGYAWVFPKKGHLSIGVLSAMRKCTALNNACERYMQRLGITPLSVTRHGFVIPARLRPEGLSRNRVLLAGDAAGLVDPVTYEGIWHALISGRLAAEAIAASPTTPESARRHYRSTIEEAILQDRRATVVLARLLYGSSRIRNPLFRQGGQKFVEAMTDLTAGRLHYRNVVKQPSLYLKLLRR